MFKIDTSAYNVFFNISMHFLNGNYILGGVQERLSFRAYGMETSRITAIRAEGGLLSHIIQRISAKGGENRRKLTRRDLRKLPKIPPGHKGRGRGSI